MTFAEWYDRNSLSCRVPELDAGPNIFVDAATSLFARGGTRIPVTLVLEASTRVIRLQPFSGPTSGSTDVRVLHDQIGRANV